MRKLKDWLTSFLEYSGSSEAPESYRLWSGISAIAACLQRKCYLRWHTEIFPNMYIVFVGPAGCRKSEGMRHAAYLLRSIGITLAANATTREALIIALKEAEQTSSVDGTVPLTHSSLTVISTEFAVFLASDFSKTLVSSLCQWYDCETQWSYETKNHDKFCIWGVWVNILGGITPELIQEILPPSSAIGGGLTGRIIFIYEPIKGKMNIFPFKTEKEDGLEEDLLHDLGVMRNLSGEFSIDESFKDVWGDWYPKNQDVKKGFDIIKFAAYFNRKPTHVLKLSMIISASSRDNMILNGVDLQIAIKMFEQIEVKMNHTFGGMGKAQLADILYRAMQLIRIKYISAKRLGEKDTSKYSVTDAELLSTFMYDLDGRGLDMIIGSMKKIGFCNVEYSQGIVPAVRILTFNEKYKGE